MADSITDFGINLLEEEIDDVIFQTNEFLTDATFTGQSGPFWWILQMCMALAALFSIIVAAGMAYRMMVKHEPLDVMKLFKPLAISIVLCWWYPPADTGITRSGSSWCVLDFLSYIPNCIGSYTHDLYEAEAAQISDKFEEVQELIHVRDTLYQELQAKAEVAHSGTSDSNLIEATMEQTGVDEVTNMEKEASKLWFTSLTAGAIVGLDKIIMLIALIVFRIGWWATNLIQKYKALINKYITPFYKIFNNVIVTNWRFFIFRGSNSQTRFPKLLSRCGITCDCRNVANDTNHLPFTL